MDNPFVGFDTFAKQRAGPEEHPYGEDSHLDDDSILERYGDVETDDNYSEPNDYDEDDDVDLQWGKVSDAAKAGVGAAKAGASKAVQTAQSAGQAAGATVGQAAKTAGGFAQDAASTGIAAGQKAVATGVDAAQSAGQAAGAYGKDMGQAVQAAGQAAGSYGKDMGQMMGQAGQEAAKTVGSYGKDMGQVVGQGVQAAGQAVGSYGKDVAGSVKAAGKEAVATGRNAAQSAFGKSYDDMMASLDHAIGFMDKQNEHRQGSSECPGEDCVIHGTPLYEREDPSPPPDKEGWEFDDPDGPYNEHRRSKGLDGNSMNKSHDDMMVSLDHAIGFMEKQVERNVDNPEYDEEDTSTYTLPNEENELDVNEIEDYDYDPELNEAQMVAIEEAQGRANFEGVEEEEVEPFADDVARKQARKNQERQKRILRETPHNPAAARLKDEEEERAFQREWVQPERNRTPTSSKKKVQRNEEDRKRLEEERLASQPAQSTRRHSRYLEQHPDTRLRGQRISTPENIATSSKENQLEAAARTQRAEKHVQARGELEAIRSANVTPMQRPERNESSDAEDDFSQSADNILAKALGSIIEIMEKQATPTPEGWDEDEYNEWLTYDAPKTPEGRKVLGMKNHEAGGDKCVGQDCVIHGTPLYEREDPY